MDSHSNDNINKNIKFYILHLPLNGIIISVVLAFFLIFNNVKFTLIVFFYILVPFLIHLILFFVFKPFTKINFKEISKTLYIISGISFLVLVCIICFYYVKPNQSKFISIEPSELESIEKQSLGSDQTYYFIFESHSCILCNNMEPVYKKAFSKMKGSDGNVFVVNLSKLSLDDPIVTSRKINGIPLLISFKGGKEQKRLTGYQEFETVNEFISTK